MLNDLENIEADEIELENIKQNGDFELDEIISEYKEISTSQSLVDFDASPESLLEEKVYMEMEEELSPRLETGVEYAHDSDFAIEMEMSLDIDIEPPPTPNDDEFDGEITQRDLDEALRIYELEEDGDIGYKQERSDSDSVLSEDDSEMFKQLFVFLENLISDLPEDKIEKLAKSEYYDVYVSMLRKFGL